MIVMIMKWILKELKEKEEMHYPEVEVDLEKYQEVEVGVIKKYLLLKNKYIFYFKF